MVFHLTYKYKTYIYFMYTFLYMYVSPEHDVRPAYIWMHSISHAIPEIERTLKTCR